MINCLPPGKVNHTPVKHTPLMNKTLITIGIIIIAAGILWPIISKLPLGRLPGDILIKKETSQLYFPITTMIIISVVISLFIWLFRK